MNAREVLKELQRRANPANIAGMARFGINPATALGISIPNLRALAKQVGHDHELAGALWDSGIHEARILACYVADPARVTARQMENWVRDFDSWDVCDQCCGNLFDRTRFAWRKAAIWSGRKEEFVRRAGFVLMASLAVHDKAAPDSAFVAFLPLIERAASDDRNFVRKAVNWALRQIGKRNRRLQRQAIQTARNLRRQNTPSARWIAADALRELTSDAVKKRL